MNQAIDDFLDEKNRCYLLIGEEENWITSLKENVWGFQKHSQGLWNTTQPNDLIAFYVTKPLQKIIGFGIVKEKFVDDRILWKDEKLYARSLWSNKISFEIIFVCRKLNNGIQLPERLFLQTSRKIVSNKFFTDLIINADLKWSSKVFENIKTKYLSNVRI